MSSEITSLPKFQWKPIQPPDVDGNTSVTATFATEGKNYSVTISYSKANLHATLDIAENEIEAKIKAVFNQLDLKQLSSLAGVSIKASLKDLQQTVITKNGEKGVSDTLQKLQGQPQYSELCTTVFKVLSVVSQHLAKPKDEKDQKRKKADLNVTVERNATVPPKKTRDLTIEFEKVEEGVETKPHSPKKPPVSKLKKKIPLNKST